MLSTQSIWFKDIIDLLIRNQDELDIGNIRTKVLGTLSINFAAFAINRKLREILPFVNQPLELKTHPELVEAMIGHNYVPIEQSILEMARAIIEF